MNTSIRIRLAALGLVALAAVMAPASMQAQHAKKAAIGAVKDVKGAKVRVAAKRAAKRKKNVKRLEKKGTPAQQTWAQSMIAERKSLKASVAAGSVSRKGAAAQRKSWAAAHPRPKK